MAKLTPEMVAVNEVGRLIKEADELVADSVKSLREEKDILAEQMTGEADPVFALDVVRDLAEWRQDMKEAFDAVIVEMVFTLARKKIREPEVGG